MVKGRVHSLESFGSVDGPGVRFLIFLQGCPMRCLYCHNVDTRSFNGGEEYSASQLIDRAERYRSYWGTNGGITVSGGEPLAQIDFLTELFEEAKKRGINTCVDTSGQPFSKSEPFFSKFKRLCGLTDLFLVDIKHIDNEQHKTLTGHGNENILEMLAFLSQLQKPVWIRHVLVPGITDDDEYLKRTRKFIDTLNNVRRVEVLPYHSLGAYKWQSLGLKYPLEGINPPSSQRVANAEKLLRCEE
ncbi:MAG TPA: pyruvate formate lyase-activating protein [Ruminococcaceae bacterium]|nr:pyruvate formate lyase-activating protein [Oscillospiraceae bacterium]